MKNRKPVPKVKINSNVGEIRLKDLKTCPTNVGIERQQKLTSTELQEILDRIRWTNNVPAQLDPPQEPTQPPPNLENIPKDENSRKMGQPNRPQRTRKLQKW